MKFRRVPGKKHEKDKILLVTTDGEEAVSLRDLAEMVVHKYYNEELLYPPPQFEGGEMVMKFLRECIKNPDKIDVIAQQFKLRKGLKLTVDQVLF